MEYKKEITELKNELKGFDLSRIGYTGNDIQEKTNKVTKEVKRKICLFNAYEELLRIENLNNITDEQIKDEVINEKNHIYLNEFLKSLDEESKKDYNEGDFIEWLKEEKNEDWETAKEELISELKREPLSIEKEEVFTILLSWGGGSDGFKLTFKNKELLRGVYFMSDWGDYEEIELNDEEAEAVFNFYMFGEYPE